jgi:hypothetical protein
MYSDIKEFFKNQSFCRVPTHEQERISNLVGPIVWSKMISDVCLSVEHADGPVPIIVLRNGKRIN